MYMYMCIYIVLYAHALFISLAVRDLISLRMCLLRVKGDTASTTASLVV